MEVRHRLGKDVQLVDRAMQHVNIDSFDVRFITVLHRWDKHSALIGRLEVLITHVPDVTLLIVTSVALFAREYRHPARVQQSSTLFLVLDDASLLACQNSFGQFNIVASGRVDSDIRRAGMLGDELFIAEIAFNDVYDFWFTFTYDFNVVFDNFNVVVLAHECGNLDLFVGVFDEIGKAFSVFDEVIENSP